MFTSVHWNNSYEYFENFQFKNICCRAVFHYKVPQNRCFFKANDFLFSKFSEKVVFKTPLDTCLLVVHLGIWKGRGGLSRITGRRFPPETTMPKTKKNMSDCFFIPCWCPCFFCVKSFKMKSAFCKYHLAKICQQLWSILKSFFELLLIPESKV